MKMGVIRRSEHPTLALPIKGKRTGMGNCATCRLLKNDSECFDKSQHERKNSNNLNISPFALSMVEGLLMGFSAAC
jgi:hypothetical protein